MKPIIFECSQSTSKSGSEISSEIADVSRWTEFQGYGLLPGIGDAEYGTRTKDMVGSRIRVNNLDGSSHTEEIKAWSNGEFISVKLHEFTTPLSHLSTHFIEDWQFKTKDSITIMTRKIILYPNNFLVKPFYGLFHYF